MPCKLKAYSEGISLGCLMSKLAQVLDVCCHGMQAASHYHEEVLLAASAQVLSDTPLPTSACGCWATALEHATASWLPPNCF